MTVTAGTKRQLRFCNLFILCASFVLFLTARMFYFGPLQKRDLSLANLTSILEHFFDGNITAIEDVPAALPTVSNFTGALLTSFTTSTLRADEAFTYGNKVPRKLAGYNLLMPHSMAPYRNEKLVFSPRNCNRTGVPWVLHFQNVWMGGSGDIYVPIRHLDSTTISMRHYSIQGGCCDYDWRNARKKPVVIQIPNRNRYCHHKLGFSLAQNHGATYSHVISELLPRAFTFWSLFTAVLRSGGVIATSDHVVPQNVLHDLGVQRSRVARLNQPCFFDDLIVPAPLFQDVDAYNARCLQVSITKALRSYFIKTAPSRQSNRPIILMLDRAKSRKGQRCRGNRCMRNFVAVWNAIKYEFGPRIELRRFSSSTSMRKTALEFANANVIVGVHGAGMSNMLYMRRGSGAIHLGWRGTMWKMYAQRARAYGVRFVNIVTPGASQNSENVVADIPVVILEIRRMLKNSGVILNPPKIKTDSRRNKKVVMRLPDKQRN